MATVLTFRKKTSQAPPGDDAEKDSSTVNVTANAGPPLGTPKVERRYFWHKKVPYDKDAIATQVR